MDPLIEALVQAVLSEMDKPFVSSNANAMTAMTRSPGHGWAPAFTSAAPCRRIVGGNPAIFKTPIEIRSETLQHCEKLDSNRATARAIWQNCCRQICRVGQRSIVQRSTRTTRASPAVRMR